MVVLSAHGTHAVLVVVRESVCCVRMRVRVGLFGFVSLRGGGFICLVVCVSLCLCFWVCGSVCLFVLVVYRFV